MYTYILFQNGEPYSIESEERVRFDNNGLTLMINRIIFKDQGIYECTASNKFRSDNAVYNITVIGMIKQLSFNINISKTGRNIWKV